MIIFNVEVKGGNYIHQLQSRPNLFCSRYTKRL